MVHAGIVSAQMGKRWLRKSRAQHVPLPRVRGLARVRAHQQVGDNRSGTTRGAVAAVRTACHALLAVHAAADADPVLSDARHGVSQCPSLQVSSVSHAHVPQYLVQDSQTSPVLLAFPRVVHATSTIKSKPAVGMSRLMRSPGSSEAAARALGAIGVTQAAHRCTTRAMRLQTPRLVLREFTEDDATAANAYESLEHVVRYQSHGTRTLQQSLQYIRDSMATVHHSPRSVFDLAVVHTASEQMIGRCGLKVTDRDQREGCLWYVLNPSHWGQGCTAEAARALMAHGFDVLKLHRLFVDTEPANTASRRVAEKLGMRQEAHFVENAWVKGQWTDSVIYGLLDREWRAAAGQGQCG